MRPCPGSGGEPGSTQSVLGTGALAGNVFGICPVCGFSVRLNEGLIVDTTAASPDQARDRPTAQLSQPIPF